MNLRRPSGPTFQEQTIPSGARLAGAAALVHELSIPAPVRRPAAVAEQHLRGGRREAGAWTIFDKRYWPGDTFADHLTFSLKHEDADLLLLKRIFDAALLLLDFNEGFADRAAVVVCIGLCINAALLWWSTILLRVRFRDRHSDPNEAEA